MDCERATSFHYIFSSFSFKWKTTFIKFAKLLRPSAIHVMMSSPVVFLLIDYSYSSFSDEVSN